MLQKLSHVERTVPKPVHEANLSFDPFIVIHGGAGQAGVKKLMLPAPDTNRDGEPRFPRSLDKRAIGRCHHFALMTVAVLRAHGISARARCGFGAYFNPPQFEDHWVCEYWDAAERRWVLADTQLDAVWIGKLQIQHDVLDVPRDRFLTAANAWKQCRDGKLDPARFGISFVQLHGLWFVAGSLIRDLASLNKVEMLPWDSWGEQPGPNTTLDGSQLRFFDQIADMTSDVDRSFDALREKYANDDRLRVPQKVFNGLKQRMEPVDLSLRRSS